MYKFFHLTSYNIFLFLSWVFVFFFHFPAFVISLVCVSESKKETALISQECASKSGQEEDRTFNFKSSPANDDYGLD